MKEVHQAVSGMKHTAEAASEIGRFGHARLKIIATPTFSSHLVPELIANFSKMHPEAMVKFEIGQDDATVEWMVSQSFDFEISISKPTNPTIDYKLVDETPMFCVVPKSHHLAQRKVIRPRDLAGETFISYMSGTRTRFEIDEIFKSQEVSCNLKYEIRTTNTIRGLVERGLAVSVIGTWLKAEDFFPAYTLIPFESHLKIQALLYWSTRRPLTTISKEFLELAKRLL